MTADLDYNTQREHLRISEYGRNVQNLVAHLLEVEDRAERTKMAHQIVKIMEFLNPEVKQEGDFEHKLWDHLYIISDFKLDVDSPYPKPDREEVFRRPDRIPYRSNLIKFRFYGRNLQYMIDTAASMEDGENKTVFLNLVASYMRNSCRNWNDENLTAETIVEHMKVLSQDRLIIDPDSLTMHSDTGKPRRKNTNTNFKSKGGKKPFNKNNNRKQR